MVATNYPITFVALRFIVYKFNSTDCNQFYIGETSRPFSQRLNEHKRSIKNKTLHSALSQHALIKHPSYTNDLDIIDFHLEIVTKCHSPVEARLAEARAITNQRPQINRKHKKAVKAY